MLPPLSRLDSDTLATSAVRRADGYDVAVIGAGVFGSWTAWALQRAGRRVVLLDAYGAANARASSGGESRVIRLGYGKDEVYTRMAMHSLERWQELSDRAELPILHRIGVLFLVGHDERYAQESLETVRRVGGRIEELSREELGQRYPQLSLNGIVRGQLEPESGALMARRGVLTLVREFVRAGGTYREEAVVPPSRAAGRLAEVATRGGDRVRAESFVFACGAWLPRVFPDVLRRRIHTTRQEVFFFGIPPGDQRFTAPAFPVWLDVSRTSAIMYGIPSLESRGFKIAADAHGPPMDPDTTERQVSAAGLAAVRAYLARRFPALARAPLVESRVCQYENTSNGDFLIDRHPELENLWFVGGGSGHGFKHGPAVGDYVVRAVIGELRTPEPRFSLATKLAEQRRAVY